jgi:hypothetical protein
MTVPVAEQHLFRRQYKSALNTPPQCTFLVKAVREWLTYIPTTIVLDRWVERC